MSATAHSVTPVGARSTPIWMKTIPILVLLGLPWIGMPTATAAPTVSVYQKHCAVCHGKNGNGKTTAGQGMNPPPTDFTAPTALVTLTKERMIQSIREGRKGTAMVAWKDLLSEPEIAEVVDTIRETLMLSSRDKDASPGQQLYANNCSVCHGDKGDVAVWARSGLAPPPRNFTSDQTRQELSRERMIFSVTYGRAETAMPAWVGRLKPEEIEQIVDYIRHSFLFPGGETQSQSAKKKPAGEHEHDHEHYDQAEMNAPMPNGLTGDAVWGKQFYDRTCADCHGTQGDGKGKRSDFIYPKPRNFLHPASQHKFNRPHLFEVISQGTRQTEMPAWNKVLTDNEIAHVTEYVFNRFIQPNTNPPGTNQPVNKHLDSHHHDAHQPEAKQPDAKQPDAHQHDSKHSDSHQPEAKQPEAKQPDAKQPDAHQHDSKHSDSHQPEAKQPDAKQPEAHQHDSKHSDSHQPEAKQPEAKQPEAKQPDAHQHDSKHSDSHLPDSKQPDAKQPDAHQHDSKHSDSHLPDSKQPDANQPNSNQSQSTTPVMEHHH
ncbi:MAG: c-type cytochrome [Magnetococcus sp. YQC-5]